GTRGSSPRDATEGTPPSRCGRGYYNLRSRDSDRPLDLPRAVTRARRHSTGDRERRVGGRERAGRRGRHTGKGCAGTTMTEHRDPSRRDFLAATAIGLIGLAQRLPREAQMDGDLLYVGTYTTGTKSEGIYLLRMDRGSGALRHVAAVDGGA